MNEYTSVESTVGKRVMFGASRWLDEKAANGSSAATIVVAVADRWRMTIPSVDLGCGATPLVAGCTSCARKRMQVRTSAACRESPRSRHRQRARADPASAVAAPRILQGGWRATARARPGPDPAPDRAAD